MTPLGVGTLAGRYRMEHRIATGGMGEVWRATDLVLGRSVAVKTLKAEHVDDEDFRARFRAEARHAGGLSHPGIASVYDYGEQQGPDGSSAWLVMELVEGEPLSDVLRRGPLDVPTTLDVVAQVAQALAVAHAAGVVHRDVKPGNLLLRPDGVVKVTDFGIAHAGDALPLTQTGTVVGTAYYLSPEQALGQRGAPASDLYSLGVVAYECLAGARPFPGTNPVAIAAAHLREAPPPLPRAVPQPVRDLVGALLAKDPADRPADALTVGRVARDLREAVCSGTDPAEVPGVPEPPPTVLVALPEAGSRAVAPASPHAARHRYALRLALPLLSVVGLALGARSCLAVTDVVVPALAPGTNPATAAVTLRDVGLLPGQRSEPSAEVASGVVLGTDPAAGAHLPAGAGVTVLVSSGRPDALVDAAQLVGRPYRDARQQLVSAGLLPVAAYDGEGTPAGTVARVEPTGSVDAGTRVVVHVVPARTSPTAPVPVDVAAPSPAPGTSRVTVGPTASAPSAARTTSAPRTTATRTTAPPATSASTATATSTAKAKGKGRGKGGGKGGGNSGGKGGRGKSG